MLTMRGIKPYGYHEPDSWVSMAGPVSLNSRANAPQLQEAKALVKDLFIATTVRSPIHEGTPWHLCQWKGRH